MIALKNILLPTDFSEPALAATRYALLFAKQWSATLHVLHVIEDPVIYLPMFESYPLPSREEFESYAQTRLDNWILPQDAEDCDIQLHWAHGKPFVEILRAAAAWSADLIVVGTHGRGMAAHLLVGSVAEKVVRKAPCPVLTVRPDARQFDRLDASGAAAGQGEPA
jgi:nucleotide-binding universal stress UspA family protein